MIAVCIKWIGARATTGVSAADEAAIEMALRHAEATRSSVIAVTVGSAIADQCLRDALACGATTAIRIDAPDAIDSAAVAGALSPVVAHSAAVWCGDYSADRGSGSVPSFLAELLDRQQALGCVNVEFLDPLRVVRRLDGGRREVLRITGPAVLSVEGSVARRRRAPLRAALAAQATEVLPYGMRSAPSGPVAAATVRPYRPRARVLNAPVGATPLDRLRALTDSSAAPQTGESVEAAPADAAQRIVEVLAEWGYLAERPA
ncbi:MAG TPA: mycofactocin-associated electron transfer flavoprotein beta subunit [Ilumatobacteraceae bacterium]|nr:mycofactocin-associated electron transfer flavoprotein beta subunit [Ilumatobacteraceae bacterium]